jgi:ABC-type polysaccharide/polyol phosphate transport system ATPase subunit
VIRRAQRRIVHNHFIALRDIHLQVRRGESLGIMGRNGAGKSTLLKVISRVIRPERGRVWVCGSLAPLLDLGAGFHPELTGRENIFLNGALLGHARRDIEEQLEQIIDYADIGEFIASPLRTYSTGMVARLAFAVATAWQPQILILDEILSVGDAEFQMKCTERIQRMRKWRDRSVRFAQRRSNSIQLRPCNLARSRVIISEGRRIPWRRVSRRYSSG